MEMKREQIGERASRGRRKGGLVKHLLDRPVPGTAPCAPISSQLIFTPAWEKNNGSFIPAS